MNHYTYMLIDPDTNMKYIGVRSCSCSIEEDTYKGSSKIMTKSEKQRSNKIIIKVFDNREDAMQHEIELHNKYDVAVNPTFWNGCKSTSTGFSVLGTTREFTEDHIQKMRDNRQGPDSPTFTKDTVYEWVHKNGEEFVGTVYDVVQHSGKDSSSFYKILKGKALYASGWRIKKNMVTNIESSDWRGYYRKSRSQEDKDKLANSLRNRTNKKYMSRYLWVNYTGQLFSGTMYELMTYNDAPISQHTTYKRCIVGDRNFASGWRIVKNLDSQCTTTDLNYGKAIKVKLTSEKVKYK